MDRRQFLIASSVAGGSWVLQLGGCTGSDAVAEAEAFEPNAWLSLARDGIATIMVHEAEMGQGVATAIPMIIAEELDLAWESVRMRLAPGHVRFRDASGAQNTGASLSVRYGYESMRRLGATARAMLLAAAAETWQVAVGELHTQAGHVYHQASGRQVAFADLIAVAQRQSVPEDVPLKRVADFNLLGQALPRLDIPEKINGRATFGMDVQLPGMYVAVLARCPTPGGTLVSLDDQQTRRVAGVHDVVTIPAGVAVLGADSYAALQGRHLLRLKWDGGRFANQNSAAIDAELDRLLTEPGEIALQRGSTAVKGDQTIEARYALPYLAHATMEPMAALAHVQADRCDVWIGTQGISRCQDAVAEALGMTLDQVHIHELFLGGGFGRRGEVDFLMEAVQLSSTVGAPVKVIWTREDDIQHDYYRPANSHQLRAVLGSQGLPLVWEHAIAAPSILRRRSPAYLENNFDASITEGAHGLAYEIPNVSVNYREADLGIPVGYWRSVGHSYNCFVVESFIDEVARAAGADPYQYRRRLLSGAPRLQRVLDVVAQAAQWGQPSGEIAGSGIAVVECYGSYVAQVVEVVNVRERFQIRRVVCAVDCGQVVNPGIVAQQMEGGIIYALTAALQGRISIANGAIEQSNFHDYPMLRLQDTPAIEVHIVPSTEPPGGAGEPGVPALAAALANALAAAGGRRQRRLPLGLDA